MGKMSAPSHQKYAGLDHRRRLVIINFSFFSHSAQTSPIAGIDTIIFYPHRMQDNLSLPDISRSNGKPP